METKEYMFEIWMDIPGYDGLYQVSNFGRVARLSHGVRKIRKFGASRGYDMVVLCKDGKTKGFLVHRLVAQVFIPNPKNLPCINHKDENKHNNAVSNLEWCNYTYNNNYGTFKDRVSKTKSYDVYQWTIDGQFVKKWRGVSTAARELGICRSSIGFCISGRYQTAGGFVWSYGD